LASALKFFSSGLDSRKHFCHLGRVAEMIKLQGRALGVSDLEQIRGLIASHATWSRRRISQALAEQWDWRNGTGQLKDMAARSLLLKLHERGLVNLPPRRRTPFNRMGWQRRTEVVWDEEPVHCALTELQPLRLEEVSRQREGRKLVEAALGEFHYLHQAGPVGENLQYCLRDRQDRPLAFALFGAPAWKCQDRDQFIGWTVEQKERNLGLVANNTRLLILPWIRVQRLGSWLLSRISRRISQDWQRKYGHRIVVLETFVEQDRFRGTVYQAANWRRAGLTKGRTRQDRRHQMQAPIKEVYLYPLQSNFREVLCA
jgi:hypothetical protein